MRRLSKSLLLVVCLILTTALWAQFETAEVLGTVRDAQGGSIPKANVTLRNKDTSIEVKGTTDENGNFDFFNVKIGRYTVTVEHAGFAKATVSDIVVNVNARQRVDIAMQVG